MSGILDRLYRRFGASSRHKNELFIHLQRVNPYTEGSEAHEEYEIETAQIIDALRREKFGFDFWFCALLACGLVAVMVGRWNGLFEVEDHHVRPSLVQGTSDVYRHEFDGVVCCEKRSAGRGFSCVPKDSE
jgi:hypothetical protein